MRWTFALLSLGLASALAHGADPARRTGVIDVEGIEVRAGNALNFPATGTLRKGDTVLIVREEETGFYAIEPPAGSVSWVKQIHLGKVDLPASGKANVAVAVDGAEVRAGSARGNEPTPRVAMRLPKGTIVEVLGTGVRLNNSTWHPITPPDGELRWVPKNAIQSGSLRAIAPPPAYERPTQPPFTVGTGTTPRTETAAKPSATPRSLTEHRFWTTALEAERSADFAKAKDLYARMYHDLWENRAESDAIRECYNRYTRCNEALKRGDAGIRSESRREPAPVPADRTAPEPKWTSAGRLEELQKVFVDGQAVYAFQDERGAVVYYATGASGLNLANYAGRKVQLQGTIAQRPELYKPHILVDRVEVAK